MTNKRSAPRQRVLKSGSIQFGGGSIDCRVRNISAKGAALHVASPVGIPDKFVLRLSDGTRFPSRVVWRSAMQIGIAFEGL